MRWGIFGGCFDPVHLGHLRCAEEVREGLRLEGVIFVPAGHPPHKELSSLTAFHHRYEMLKLATKGNPGFIVSDMEGRGEQTTYSIDTVIRLRNVYPKDDEFFFLIGQDAFDAITTWKDWERLLGMCHFVVMTRPGYARSSLAHILTPTVADRFTYDEWEDRFLGPEGYGIYMRQVTFLEIEASRIRYWAKEGKSIRYVTPCSVEVYIGAHGLYRSKEGT